MKTLVAPEIESYAQAQSMPESDTARALREETQRTMAYAQMLVGPLEGAFLKMMAQLVGATRVLEIGMFTGYSALCFAEALPADGRVVTCEIDESSAALGRKHFANSPHGKKIEIRRAGIGDHAGAGRSVRCDLYRCRQGQLPELLSPGARSAPLPPV